MSPSCTLLHHCSKVISKSFYQHITIVSKHFHAEELFPPQILDVFEAKILSQYSSLQHFNIQCVIPLGRPVFVLTCVQPTATSLRLLFFADGNHDGRPFVVSVRNCVMWISVRATHRTKTPDIIGVRLINGDITASYFCTYHKAFCCIFKTFSRAFWRAWETPACSNPVLTFIIHAVTQSQVS